MKTMFRLLSTSVLLFFCLSVSAQKKDIPAAMLGKWNFTMEDPQSGGETKGTCTLTKTGDIVKALLSTDYGEAETSALRPNDNGKFYADVDIAGYPLTANFTWENETLGCELDAGGMVLPLKLTKAE